MNMKKFTSNEELSYCPRCGTVYFNTDECKMCRRDADVKEMFEKVAEWMEYQQKMNNLVEVYMRRNLKNENDR